MRILIVDDEAPARARLRRLLTAFADVEVIAEAGDGEQALRQTAALMPDALLLDIQMPGANGLDVAASLAEPAPMVVFVTAYDQFALQAFDAAAIDYLLKPVEAQRLARAIQRLRDRASLHTAGLPERRPPPTRLLIADRGRMQVIAVADILWLEAADNYVVVHTAERAPLMRRTLAGLLLDLGPAFIRTHRGAAVAARNVIGMKSLQRGDGVVLLSTGITVPCSRQHRAAVLAHLTRSD